MSEQGYDERSLEGLAQRLEVLERENAALRQAVAAPRESAVAGVAQPRDPILEPCFCDQVIADTTEPGPAVSAQHRRNGTAIAGHTDGGTGVFGQSDRGFGVHGDSRLSTAAFFHSVLGIGAHGDSNQNTGVFGSSISGLGVHGASTSSLGVRGQSGNNTGVLGHSDFGLGVHGAAKDNTGVFGSSDTGFGVHGSSNRGRGGVFFGGVDVHGNFTVVNGTKNFQIDHPLDPQNKYLVHNAVESAEMKNVYDGVAQLDENGAAWVDLPEWCEALNGDFRYQLTAVGGAAPDLHVAAEIYDNRFQIAGGEGGMKVCWQLTGTRKDPWAAANPLEVEQEKPEKDRGHYLQPDLYGAPEEQRAVAPPPPPLYPDALRGQIEELGRQRR